MRKNSWGLDWQREAWNGIKGIAFLWLMGSVQGNSTFYIFSFYFFFKAKQQDSSNNKKGLCERNMSLQNALVFPTGITSRP